MVEVFLLTHNTFSLGEPGGTCLFNLLNEPNNSLEKLVCIWAKFFVDYDIIDASITFSAVIQF